MPSAYIIAHVSITDPTQYEQYKKLSTVAMQTYGAEVCVRGGAIEVIEGEDMPDDVYERFADFFRGCGERAFEHCCTEGN
jgi:uncharacterized protein (DUF1330 family)